MADIKKAAQDTAASIARMAQLQDQIVKAALTVPTFPRIQMPDIGKLVLKDYLMADTFYEHLKHHVEETEKELAEDEQLAVVYRDSVGQSFVVRDISYHNPNLIILYAQDANENECSILAHMNTVQLVLIRVKVKEAKPYRIGFLKDSGDRNAEDET